jgi:hypothetical protein
MGIMQHGTRVGLVKVFGLAPIFVLNQVNLISICLVQGPILSEIQCNIVYQVVEQILFYYIRLMEGMYLNTQKFAVTR